MDPIPHELSGWLRYGAAVALALLGIAVIVYEKRGKTGNVRKIDGYNFKKAKDEERQ